MKKQNFIIILILVLIGIFGYFTFTNQGDTVTVRVFFSNSQEDPQALDCEKVYSVERQISENKLMAQTVLEELLKGPILEEQEKGYFTSINSGVNINSLVIEDNIAKVDFDEQLEYQLGGSCRVMAIRSQITETLLQFSEIVDVIISVNGRTEDILQP